MAGEPVKIAFLEKNRIKINVDNFGAILQQVGHRPVSIVSINGPMRTGKSYMLGHFLRYLDSRDRSNGDWFHQTLTNEFHWKSSSDRQTTGIMMWSKPYFVRKDGREIGVLLMDTQGCFDSQTTTAENSFIFSLSCLFSSVLIYNVRQQVAEDTLQNLQLFVEYSKLALNKRSAKASSKLILLIRDWEVPDDYAYGYYSDEYMSEGLIDNYKKQKMDIQQNMPEEVKVVHEAILSSFTSVECCLLPHPGLNFSTRGEKNGLEQAFVTCVMDFVPRILGTDSIVTKTVCGEEVTGLALLELVKQWSDVFATCKMPAARNVAEAAAEVQLGKAKMFAIKHYKSSMQAAVEDEDMSAEMLERKHQVAQQKAQQIFDKMKGIEHKKAEKRILKSLQMEMEESYTFYKGIYTCKQNLRDQQKKDAEITRQRQELEQQRQQDKREREEYQQKVKEMEVEKKKQRLQEQKEMEEKLREHSQNQQEKEAIMERQRQQLEQQRKQDEREREEHLIKMKKMDDEMKQQLKKQQEMEDILRENDRERSREQKKLQDELAANQEKLEAIERKGFFQSLGDWGKAGLDLALKAIGDSIEEVCGTFRAGFRLNAP